MDREKKTYLQALCNKEGVINALAIDQRGSLKKMIEKDKGAPATDEEVIDFKKIASEELTKYASAILLDPDYGIPAGKARNAEAGLLTSYEKTGYDGSGDQRFPDLLDHWSAKRIKELGSDAVKFLLYYDVDEDKAINDQKQAFVERIGAECKAEGIPLFVELIAYDGNQPTNDLAFAKKKPRKVLTMMKEFAKERYGIDVLKMEVPVNMAFVEGFAKGEVAYTKAEAQAYFKEQGEITDKPYIFLSAGVSTELFRETLIFAGKAGARFSGVLCGRATWAEGLPPYVKEGEEACRQWMRSQGRADIEALNDILKEYATPIQF